MICDADGDEELQTYACSCECAFMVKLMNKRFIARLQDTQRWCVIIC